MRSVPSEKRSVVLDMRSAAGEALAVAWCMASGACARHPVTRSHRAALRSPLPARCVTSSALARRSPVQGHTSAVGRELDSARRVMRAARGNIDPLRTCIRAVRACIRVVRACIRAVRLCICAAQLRTCAVRPALQAGAMITLGELPLIRAVRGALPPTQVSIRPAGLLTLAPHPSRRTVRAAPSAARR
jgi:hypothetical protein